MQLNRPFVVVLAVILTIALSIPAQSDILFKGKQAQKIGKGTQDGSHIRWTDCNGRNAETFDDPPYSLDKMDNCAVGPPGFGLECDGENCKVVDEQILGRYLKGVHNGAKVRLRIEEHSVELKSDTATLTLER